MSETRSVATLRLVAMTSLVSLRVLWASFRVTSCSYFFFFSSRRRHTRSDRDWSSDVCSSDLGAQVLSGGWGLAIGAGVSTNRATYATVANASGAVWSEPVPGEVWLHEWLHGEIGRASCRERV